VALLLLFAAVLLLYVNPARSYLRTWHDSHAKRAELHRLQAVNDRLRARRQELYDPAYLETQARRMGMIRAGERAYVVHGLPGR